jgi:hypothetical protein
VQNCFLSRALIYEPFHKIKIWVRHYFFLISSTVKNLSVRLSIQFLLSFNP